MIKSLLRAVAVVQCNIIITIWLLVKKELKEVFHDLAQISILFKPGKFNIENHNTAKYFYIQQYNLNLDKSYGLYRQMLVRLLRHFRFL